MDREERDIQWLGNDGKKLGPLVRAALGILLESGDWSWWDSPSKTSECLEAAIQKHKPARWGGDSSVMDADQWVDPLRAFELSQAFEMLIKYDRPKIKILRSVWSWPNEAYTVKEVILELSCLVGSGHVFPEWEKNIKPRFPKSELQQGRGIITSRNVLSLKFTESISEEIKWIPSTSVADIVVADCFDALHFAEAAKLVILYSQDILDEFSYVGNLRKRLCAQCVVYIDAEQTDVESWLEILIKSWTTNRNTLSDALEIAERASGLTTAILSSTQSFLSRADPFSRTFEKKKDQDGSYQVNRVTAARTPLYRTDNESTLQDFDFTELFTDYSTDSISSSLTDIPLLSDQSSIERTIDSNASALRPTRPRQVNLARPAPPVERVLNAETWLDNKKISTWPHKGTIQIKINIQVKSPLQNSQPSFPDDRIEWSEDKRELQVHLFELGRAPQTENVLLSRTGNSTSAIFKRESDTKAIDLRILISDGAQILQTARYQTAPGEKINFFIENIVTPVQRVKKPFDFSLLVNDSLGSEPSLTIITGDGSSIFSPLTDSEVERARNRLLQDLEQAVANPNASLEPLMLKLANHGALLQRHLQSVAPEWPGSTARIQLVTQSDAFFPIEYLYDGKIPESTNAPLCAKRDGCLRNGNAIPDCSLRKAATELCPMGFLGISGFIERHAWKSGQTPRMWSAPGAHKVTRHRVTDLSTIAFTASDRADRFLDSDVYPHQAIRVANIEKSLGVRKISDWKSWKDKLAIDTPKLLLMLLHLEESKIFIGNDDGINLAAINEQHVGNAPIVIAIGCSSGIADMPGGSLPAILQRSGARVVIAAMTNVLGRHANRVGHDLVVLLKEAARDTASGSIGMIISKIRRELLADGLALGLALVAFGDADILLGHSEQGE